MSYFLIFSSISFQFLFSICRQSQYTFKELPFLVFGGLSLVAAGVSLLLPETRGIRLPDTVEEVEGLKPVEHELKEPCDKKACNEDLIQADRV